MNVPNVGGGLTKDEVEAAQIYCVLVLRRIAGEEEEEEEGEPRLGKPRFNFEDSEDLDRIFDLSKDIASQIYELLIYERKQNDEVLDSQYIVNSIVIACDKKDFEQLFSLVMGLKYVSKSIRDIRFLVKEMADLVKAQLYAN